MRRAEAVAVTQREVTPSAEWRPRARWNIEGTVESALALLAGQALPAEDSRADQAGTEQQEGRRFRDGCHGNRRESLLPTNDILAEIRDFEPAPDCTFSGPRRAERVGGLGLRGIQQEPESGFPEPLFPQVERRAGVKRLEGPRRR